MIFESEFAVFILFFIYTCAKSKYYLNILFCFVLNRRNKKSNQSFKLAVNVLLN